jgi:hypothetical protein
MILPTPGPGDSRWERWKAAFRLLKERDGSGARHLFAAKSEPGTGSPPKVEATDGWSGTRSLPLPLPLPLIRERKRTRTRTRTRDKIAA